LKNGRQVRGIYFDEWGGGRGGQKNWVGFITKSGGGDREVVFPL